MITHILYHRLDVGELAIYDKADEVEQYWHLDPPYWNCHRTHRRISNFTNLHLSLEELQRDLPQWLQALPAEEGSLIYSVHLNDVIDGVHLIDAGLSFVSYPMGVPLTVDPVQAILDLSRARTPEQVGRLHPNIRAVRDLRGFQNGWGLFSHQQREREERATQRSRMLLYEHLTEEQIADLEELGHFQVLGMDGHQYRIMDKTIHNVFRLENDRPSVEYCIVVQGRVPLYDQLLAQKMLLEADIDTFMRVSNKWDLTGRDLPQGAVRTINLRRPILWDLEAIRAAEDAQVFSNITCAVR